MNLQEAIDMKIKSSYLEEMQQAKEMYFHDFPKYLQVTRKLIDTYESEDMQRVAGILINEDIKKGIFRVEGSEILCNCESCQIGDKDVKEILDNVIRDLFVKPLENPLAKYKREQPEILPIKVYKEVIGWKTLKEQEEFEKDYNKLKEFHDKHREQGLLSNARFVMPEIEKFCLKYKVDIYEIIDKLNEDVE